MSATLLPWQLEQWETVMSQVAANRLPHALLLAGPSGLGKRQFANRLIDWRLCALHDEYEIACGTCPNCLLRLAETHPDRFVLMPEEGSGQIKIDQIRAMVDWAYQTAQRGEGKFVLIEPAEALNVQAANALLKCLEEPPEGTHFVLIADTPGQLLPTIRSRSSTLFFRTPQAKVATDWLGQQPGFQPNHSVLLQIAGGAPLAVQDMIEADYLDSRRAVLRVFAMLKNGESPVAAAAFVSQQLPDAVISVMVSLILDLLRMVRGDRNIRHEDVMDQLVSLADNVPELRWFSLLDYLVECRALLASGANPNRQLMMEGLCTRTAEAVG
ncbi:MAG: DNA polymerase III subunit delta' [Pseudomonadales bacterium]|nr:DNA polymerase III subunit delta' [Pseudomonadales bacterium]